MVAEAGHPLQPRQWGIGSYEDRFRLVRPYLEGKTVLDVGCASGHWRGDWLHARVAAVAKEAIGLDHSGEWVEILTNQGYNIVLGDAQNFDFGRKFDVVFAGELIEHLSCFEGFLNSARRHLQPEGRLVLTTPNAFTFTNFVYRIGGKPWVNPDHTCWFCETTIKSLLNRHGWNIEELRYIPHRSVGIRKVAALVRFFLPERLKWDNMLVVAQPVSLAPDSAAT